MRIEVIGKHMTVTDAIRSFCEQKAGKLLKFFDGGVQMITVRVEESQHKTTKSFRAEVTVDVVGHDDFVANDEGPDMYACIDHAVEKAARQLHDHKEKLRDKRGATPAGG